MSKKGKGPEPLITSAISVIRRGADTRPFTEDEIRAEKREMHRVLKDSLAVFQDNLRQGYIEMNTSSDLERLIKATLLIMGEPEGRAEAEEEKTVFVQHPLSLEDPDVRAVYEKLTGNYNEQNDDRESETR